MLSIINTHFEVGASIVISKYSLIEKKFWETLKNSKVTSFNGVPYTYEILTKIGLKNIKIKTLKYLTHAGGKLEKDKLNEIIKICKRKKIKIIEDAATAFGAKINNKRIGSFNDSIAVFSFYANKIITTGEGGVVTLNNTKIAKKIRKS